MKRNRVLVLLSLVLSIALLLTGVQLVPAETTPTIKEPLADFLARIAGRVTPTELKAAAARAAAARERAIKNGYVAPLAIPPGPGDIPDYFGTPNWANSPALTKFLDPLPGLYIDGLSPVPAPGTKYIPVAIPDTTTYADADYYEIELGQYTQQLHSELGPTTIRGYRQTNTTNTYVNGFHYLGPVILATKDKPVRIKFTNALPAGVGGKLSVPVDTSIMGSGDFLINFDPVTKSLLNPNNPADPLSMISGNFTENRATLHLHGGHSPWISDGTPHQWVAPAGELGPYTKGVSVAYVPDMWFDASGNTITSCAGQTTCTVPGASNDPGPGAQTFFWSNQQSARLMFYHDHAWGITRLNVYVGEAAGFLLTDPKEQQLIGTGGILESVWYGTPLVIQFKTFVDANPASPTYVRNTDPTWGWGPIDPLAPPPAGSYPAPASGDLWLPHVYMSAQNPYNPDLSGINAYGRWHYGPWFFPPTPVCGSSPQAVKPMCVEFGTVPNEYYDPACNPAVTGFCQPPRRPGTPNVSWGGEAFHDTAMVNGAVFPVHNVDPKPYRFRILNADNDKFLNLQLYKASPIISSITITNAGSGYTTPPTVTISGDGVGATAVATISPMGVISGIAVDTAGSGYNPAATAVTITGDGSGATAYALVNAVTGAIDGIVVSNGGSGYTAATVDINGDGSGATATATITPGLGDVTDITLTSVGSGYTAATVAIAPPPGAGVQATADAVVYTALTEVGMVPAAAAPGYPASWPADGREGGVPDPAKRGPAFLQIGTEGGFLPGPVVLPNQPVAWNLDPTMFNVGNVLNQKDGGGTLMLGPAERADVIVDFTNYANQTLILYNDGPSAWPALDPHYDYYTGAPDRRDMGGYGPIPPGKGPNVRTIMQIKVSNVGGGTSTTPPDDYNAAIYSALQNASKSSGSTANPPFMPGIFADSQDPVIVGQAAYNSTYNKAFPQIAPYWGISAIGDNALSFLQPDGLGGTTQVTDYPMLAKAMHDEMGASFDDYGRMSAKLGLETPFTNTAISNFNLQNYVDPPSEIIPKGGYQIWKITHNGVDTHPIHFHLFEVQLVNRVGWDGFYRLPDANELGWKDTIRISPLEDTIVALRPIQAVVPFAVPDSVRPLNPMRPVDVGDDVGFSQINPVTGNAMAPPQTNTMYNFGWEYVWHCHILSHEENDMMRSIVFQVEPGAPIITSVVPGNTQATVFFTPFSTGGSPIQLYSVKVYDGLTLVNTVSGVQSPITVTGLTNCKTYTFTVTATNSIGTGPESAPSAGVIPDTVPVSPTMGLATAGNALATVTFTGVTPAAGCNPILSYTVTSNPGGITAVVPGATPSPITAPVAPLVNGTTYVFTVTATNAIGTGTPSLTSNPVIPATVPGAPSIVSVTPGNAQATVTFTAPVSNGGIPITSYRVTATPTVGAAVVQTASVAPFSPYTVTGLTNGVVYTFTVAATNGMGTGADSAPVAGLAPNVVARMQGAVYAGTYATIQSAYNASANGDVIALQTTTFTESPVFSLANNALNVSVVLNGGYDAAFSAQTGFTTIKGVFTVSAGSVVMNNVIIQP